MILFQSIKDLINQRSLITRMIFKEVTDRYAGSSLGLIWTVLQPLSLILIYVLIFTFIFKVNFATNESRLAYALYALTGLIPWISMAEGLSKSISAIISKVPLVKQAIFPINILPVVSVSASFISLMVGITIYLILMLIFAPNQLSLYLLLLPLVVFFQFIFMLGLGYLLAIGGVYFRDLQELIGLLLTIGMFVTPILWTDEMVPHVFAWPMRFNLLAHLIYMYRDILFYGRIIHPLSFAIFLPTSIAIFIVGYLSFNKVKHLFANIL